MIVIFNEEELLHNRQWRDEGKNQYSQLFGILNIQLTGTRVKK
jgi:hypothetical protein